MKRKAEGDDHAAKRARSPAKLEVGDQYPALYRAASAQGGSAARLELFAKVNDEENVYREMFAQERETARPIQNPTLMMIDAHAHEDIFAVPAQDAHEKALPRVFKQAPEVLRGPGESAIVSKKEFLRNFDVFTESQLRFMDWSNVLVAGGSVLACLQPVPEPHNKNNRTRREYFHKVAYKSSDVDLFVYGLDEEHANRKLQEVYEAVQESIPAEAIAFRSQHAITIVSQYPYRHIQIVLRLYKSPAEILMGFDVDACAVGFDGERVLMMPRAHRALTHQYNTIDMSRRSPSYEMRLAKYSQRGFEVLVPSLSPSKVDPQIFERRFDQLQGLAKLLVLEKLEAPEYRTKYKEQQRMRRLRPAAKERQTFWSGLDSTFSDEWSRERLQGSANASDYSTVFLPWGPKWTASRVRKLMYTKDMILNSKWYDPKKKIHTHPCFFGTIDEVVKDCCGQCPPVPPEDVDPDSPFVSGSMEWVTVDPGAQRIGSFHPITEGDWTEGAYIHSSMEKLAHAVNADDLPALTDLLKSTEEVDLDARDSVGRTLLHLAVLSGAIGCARFLITRKVRIGAKMCDGRTALHLAAQYGRSEIIPVLLARAKELKDEAEKKQREKEDAGMEEEEEEEEEEEGDGDDEVDEEFCIRAIVERKKKEETAAAAEPAQEDDALDVNDKDWDLNMTALHYAIFFGSDAIIPMLLDKGAALDPVKFDNNRSITPLALCVYNSQVSTARLLLKRGANVDDRDAERKTALHKAAAAANVVLIRLLCEEGANVNAFDRSFSTPLNELLDAARKRSVDDGDGAVDDDPMPPHQLAALRCLVEEFDAAVSYGKEHLPSAAEQQQFNMSLGNAWGSPSDQQRLRTGLRQPLHQAVAMRSPAAVQYLLVHIAKLGRNTSPHVNWINGSTQTPLDYTISALEELSKSNFDWHTQRLIEEKEVLEAQRKSLEKKKGSDLLLHEVKCRLAELDADISSKQEASEEHQASREAVRAHVTAVKKLLEQHGGKEFKKMKLEARDKDLKDEQRGSKWSHHSHRPDPLQLTFRGLGERLPDRFVRHQQYDERGQKLYAQFFDAVHRGDVASVRKMVGKPVGQQTHASSAHSLGRSTLHMAAINNSLPMLRCLLEASVAQFTPLKARKKKEADGAVSINNYDLAMLMNQVKPGEYLQADGTARAEYEEQDQNEAPVQLNCITSPSTYLRHTDGQNRNVLHFCALLGHTDAVKTIEEFCTEHKLPEQFYADSDDAKERKPLLNALLGQRDRTQLTPFELALAQGHVGTAKVLLGLGGVDVSAAEAAAADDDEQYAGLDVGGKKMDWALEHRASTPKHNERSRGALHVVAQYQQSDSAAFLMDKAGEVWRTYLQSVDVDEEAAAAIAARNFSLDAVDDKGNTPLHYAAGRDHHAVLLTMLERATDEQVNRRNADGVTALHVAAARGHVTCVSHLLTWLAHVEDADTKRGWTALHFAAMQDHDKVARMLLRYLKADAASALSNKFHQTAAVVAAYYGSRKVLDVLVGDKQRKCDVNVRDVCGDGPLYHAVKQQHLHSVRTLLSNASPEELAQYRQENGVGLTVVDCARLKLVGWVREGNVPVDSAAILEVVSDKIGEERVVAQTEDVRNVTYIMLNQAQADAEKEMAAAEERSRCYWRFKADDTEVEGQTHGGDVSMPTYSNIPQLP